MKLFDLPETQDRVSLKKLAANDTAKHSIIALPVIMAFEVFMMIKWIIDSTAGRDPHIGYLIGYIGLTGLSVLALVFCILGRKDIEKRWRWVQAVQTVYAVGIVAWALAFTHIDAVRHTTFSPIINITIITIVPVFTFLNPFIWLGLELIDAGYIIFLWSKYIPSNSSFLINYTVFAIISIIASLSLYLLRYQSYLRQVLLVALTEGQKIAARTDALTGLLNRRAYADDEALHLESGMEEDLVVIAFDINGLKQINDTKGHKEGDLLIKTAARILRDTFSSFGTIYRTGGDEFIGVLYAKKEEIDRAIETLREKENGSDLPDGLVVAIAVGYSEAREHEKASFHALEIEADQRMYQDKQKYHQAR